MMPKGTFSKLCYPLLVSALLYHSAGIAATITHETKVGDITLTALSESQSDGKIDKLLNFSDADKAKLAPDGTYKAGLNAFLVQSNGKNVLVDTGFGTNLFDNLASLNVKPENVDTILLTHMHPDHIGGLLKDGKVTFPDSRIYVSQKEYEYWKDNEKVKPILDAYRDQITRFVPEEIGSDKDLLPGIDAWQAYGHTPGHTVYFLHSKNSSLLIIADLTHAVYIQAAVPDVAITYDVDPQMAVKSRKAIFDYVSAHKIPVAGMHVPFPGSGKLLSTGNGSFTFQPD